LSTTGGAMLRLEVYSGFLGFIQSTRHSNSATEK
jgi:hypothetical protein